MTTITTDNQPSITNENRWEQWADEGLPHSIDQRLGAGGAFSQSARQSVVTLAAELGHELETSTPLRAVDRFLARGETFINRVDRRAVVITLEHLDHLKAPALPWPRWAPDDPFARERVLTEIEIGLVRMCAVSSSGKAGAIAALDAGAISGELGILLGSMAHLGPDGMAIHLDAPGTLRPGGFGYTAANPRRLTVPTWAAPRFKELMAKTGDDQLLLYGGSSTNPGKIQSSILMIVGKVLGAAGLSGDATVKPQSIRNTAARKLFENEGLEAAADLLGHDDYTAVAEKIGIRSRRVTRSSRSR